MKVKRNPVSSSYQYQYEDSNGCALLAIAYAFKVNYKVVYKLFELAGRKHGDGVTNDKVEKVIKVLGELRKKHITYIKNTKRISLKKFTETTKKGQYLLDLSEHISYFSNRALVDEFISCEEDLKNSWIKDKTKLLGWWEIHN